MRVRIFTQNRVYDHIMHSDGTIDWAVLTHERTFCGTTNQAFESYAEAIEWLRQQENQRILQQMRGDEQDE